MCVCVCFSHYATKSTPLTADVACCAAAMRELGLSHYLQQHRNYLTHAAVSGVGVKKQKQLTIQECIQGQQHKEAAAAAAAAEGTTAGTPAASSSPDTAAAAPQAPGTGVAAAAATTAGAATLTAVAETETGHGSKLKPFPLPGALPGAAVSNTWLTRQLLEAGQIHKRFRRSVMEQAALPADILAADFQHGPTKNVHVTGGRAASAIFNLMDVKTGENLGVSYLCFC